MHVVYSVDQRSLVKPDCLVKQILASLSTTTTYGDEDVFFFSKLGKAIK